MFLPTEAKLSVFSCVFLYLIIRYSSQHRSNFIIIISSEALFSAIFLACLLIEICLYRLLRSIIHEQREGFSSLGSLRIFHMCTCRVSQILCVCMQLKTFKSRVNERALIERVKKKNFFHLENNKFLGTFQQSSSYTIFSSRTHSSTVLEIA